MSKVRTPKRPDWATVEVVVGSREDLSHTGVTRVCRDCGQDVFTAQPYPHDVAVICEVCFAALPPDSDPLPSDPEQMTDAQLVRLCQQHTIRIDASLPALQAEANRRGVELRVVLRQRLLDLLKEKGVV